MPAPEGRFNHVTITHAGQKWSGQWVQVGKLIEVCTAYGSVTIDPVRRDHEKAAADALKQLVDQWRAKRGA